jgi:hypothetical protein
MTLNLVPTRQPLGRNPLVQVVLPIGAVETLDMIARREGASRSALCRTFICEALERLALTEREVSAPTAAGLAIE